jgi:protein TonB
MKKRLLSASAVLYGGSFVLHVGLAVGVSLLPKQKKTEVVAISMASQKKKAEKPEPPKPPPPAAPEPPAAKAKASPLPKAAAPPPPEPQANTNAPPPAPGMENLLDLGMMGNGTSGGASLGARAPGAGPRAAPTTTATTKKLETLAPVTERCTDPVVKPKRKGGPQPAYTTEARQAEIEGLVKIEVTVDESGHVIAARVAGGLGYGLDEAAIVAAKKWTFDPASKCGQAITFAASLPFRFKLGT